MGTLWYVVLHMVLPLGHMKVQSIFLCVFVKDFLGPSREYER